MHRHLYPAPYECRALDTKRGELERMRDRRSQSTVDPVIASLELSDTLAEFVIAEEQHMTETGCRDRH